MRWFILAAILLLAAGVGCVLYAQSFPIYSDAPSRISEELLSFPPETRFKEWSSRLHAIETPHKRLSDGGRGLCAAGVGLLVASSFWRLYHRSPRWRSVGVILSFWRALWLIRIPLTVWYYFLRQLRSDYPWWADSIAIPIFSETISWLIGLVVSSVILRRLLRDRSLPPAIRFVRPASWQGWVRAVFIALWIAFLALCIYSGVPDGDEGAVFTSIVATVILLAVLCATEVPRPEEMPTTAAEPAASGA